MEHSKAFLALVNAAKKRIAEISASTTLKTMGRNTGTVVVDVREDSEWNAGHIAGAIHLGRGIIERDVEIAISDKDAEIILYCGGGFRSALSADNLQKMGYTNVYSMKGGWRKWNALGYPVTKKRR